MPAPAYPTQLLRTGVVATWAIFSIHHAYEAGLSRAGMPIDTVVAATVVLLLTLVLLDRYGRTGGRWAFVTLSVVTLVAWVGTVGLVEGLYGHTLKDVLFWIFDMPPGALPRTNLGLLYDVPTDVFGEVTGVLPFFLGIWIAISWAQMARSGRCG